MSIIERLPLKKPDVEMTFMAVPLEQYTHEDLLHVARWMLERFGGAVDVMVSDKAFRLAELRNPKS